jgi:uncharacterized protein (DUF849 family)
MLLKAAINGGRAKAQHAAVPVTPEEQAADVVACINAGAHAIHLHVRSADGKESLDAQDVAKTLAVVRAAAPEAKVGVSTGAWIVPGTAERFAAIESWTVQPDFASVNFSEAGAVELAELFLTRNVGLEAGLIAPADARALIASGLASSCLRILIEPQEQDLKSALKNVDQISLELSDSSITSRLLLHGTEVSSWPMLDEAVRRGWYTRMGLEDTIFLPSGKLATGNAELIAAAVNRS